MYLPDVPVHVVQRGNNRTKCFFEKADYNFYLSCLDEARQKYKVQVHAYVLMTNHVHLLMTPNDAEGISRLMQSIGRRYVQYINITYRRSGTLWEGRHRTSLIHAEDYLLTCYMYIEMNPVRANMVENPGDYAWSSYRTHAYGETNNLIQDHIIYQQLDKDAEKRREYYRELLLTGIKTAKLREIRKALNFSMPLGNRRFCNDVEQALGRKLGYSRRGRPANKMYIDQGR